MGGSLRLRVVTIAINVCEAALVMKKIGKISLEIKAAIARSKQGYRTEPDLETVTERDPPRVMIDRCEILLFNFH